MTLYVKATPERFARMMERLGMQANSQQPRSSNMSTPTIRGKRFCYVIIEGQRDEKKGYIPSAAIEGETGHSPMMGNGPHAAPWYWGLTKEEADQTCKDANAKLGLTQKDVDQITASTMQGSFR